MSQGGVLRCIARRLPAVDERIRGDLVASVDEMATRGTRIDRALEGASLIGFALRTTSRRGVFDDRRELILQGLRVGALVLAIAAAGLAWAVADDLGRMAVAASASAVAVTIAGGLRRAVVVLAAVHVLLQTLVGGAPDALAVVVLGAVLVGHRFDDRSCPVGSAVTAVALIVGGAAAVLAPASVTTVSLTVAATVVPVVLLVIGWFDPRYAVAATVVWMGRLVAIDAMPTFVVTTAAAVVVAGLISTAAIDRCLGEPAANSE